MTIFGPTLKTTRSLNSNLPAACPRGCPGDEMEVRQAAHFILVAQLFFMVLG
jgi:hypothetical protein